jgi:hypothetical protein
MKINMIAIKMISAVGILFKYTEYKVFYVLDTQQLII